MNLLLTRQAQRDFDGLPLSMKHRLMGVFERLQRYPALSGVKPLTGNWKGYFRLRAGDWRVVFRLENDAVVIERIAHRREVYE